MMPNLSITILNNKEVPISDSRVFKYMKGDATQLDSVAGFEYDVCHSNSVIEHVGDWNKKRCFAAEVRRIAEKYFVQTPSFWFPVEPHFVTPFFHWLPKPLRISMVSTFDLGWHRRAQSLDDAVAAVEGSDLLTYRMMRCLFPDAVVHRERLLFVAKSFVAVRERASKDLSI